MIQKIIASKDRGNIPVLVDNGKIILEELFEDEEMLDIEPYLEIKKKYLGEPVWDFEKQEWIITGEERPVVIPETTLNFEDYFLDLEFRLTMIELGGM